LPRRSFFAPAPKRVLKLELDALFTDLKDNSEAAKRVESVLTELARTKGEIILFIGELSNFVGSAAVSGKLLESLLQTKYRSSAAAQRWLTPKKIEATAEIAALFAPIY
jgi:hypothetical protein